MYRKSAIAAALFFITASSNLHALGLGEIDMQSALNQPMNAAIELTSAANTDLSRVTITLASQADHQRIGLSRSRILNDFDFSVESDNRGNAVIRITSHGAVHEPFLEFLLELTWPNGRLLREYTVLIDPPITMPATPARPATPVSRVPASPAVAQPQYRASRPASTTAGSTASTTATSADSYGPIRRNETLWSIAEKLRPDTGISMHQMMLALQRKNPQAFTGNNINSLNAGATLKVPSRNEILSVSASEAYAETQRQYAEWKQATQPAEPAQETSADVEPGVEPDTGVITESRLQLMAPDSDAVEGMATSGDPVEATGDSGEVNADMLNQQLALATEEAEANKAQSAEFQSQVSELEEQVETMKRLLVLKDEQLASIQQRLSTDADNEAVAAEEILPEEATQEAVDEVVPVEETATEAVVEEQPARVEEADEPRGIVNQLMDNPLLAGFGVLVALLLGGFLWNSTRKRQHSGIFDDEITLQGHMASEAADTEQEWTAPVFDVNESDTEPAPQPVAEPASNDSDPLTEADVYLAYGRIQQAEDVLQSALASSPEDSAIRLKLLEVYHAAGNEAAFDREASDYRDTVTEEDASWMQVASMGYAMSPGNELYRAAATQTADANTDLEMDFPEPTAEANTDPDMDFSEMENIEGRELSLEEAVNEAPDSVLPETIEYTLDDAIDNADAEAVIDEEDASEGLLSTADEVTTKLDLARAYLDMGDPEGARSILGEVMEEGNDEQKNEAEELISQLA
jgi:pilus assembly protein FimV